MTTVLDEKPEPGTMCAWFAKCDRPAVVFVSHPILVRVPCCQRCADFATS